MQPPTINLDPIDLPLGDWIPIPALRIGRVWYVADILRSGLPPPIRGDPIAGYAIMRGMRYRCTFYRYEPRTQSADCEFRKIGKEKYLFFAIND